MSFEEGLNMSACNDGEDVRLTGSTAENAVERVPVLSVIDHRVVVLPL